MNAIVWLSTHWVEIVAAVSAVMMTARVLVKLTPTPKDDSILEIVVTALKQLGLVVEDKPPGK